MPYLTIEVKQSHINRGYKNPDDSTACVIALAAQAALHDKNVMCFFDNLFIGVKKVCTLPASALKLQRNLFNGKPKSEIKPFSFRVKIA